MIEFWISEKIRQTLLQFNGDVQFSTTPSPVSCLSLNPNSASLLSPLSRDLPHPCLSLSLQFRRPHFLTQRNITPLPPCCILPRPLLSLSTLSSTPSTRLQPSPLPLAQHSNAPLSHCLSEVEVGLICECGLTLAGLEC